MRPYRCLLTRSVRDPPTPPPSARSAVEEALRLRLRLKSAVISITALSIGPPKALDRLRTALAMGADRGMHAALPDGAPTSRALASSRRADAQYAREVYVEVKRSIGSCAHGE